MLLYGPAVGWLKLRRAAIAWPRRCSACVRPPWRAQGTHFSLAFDCCAQLYLNLCMCH